MKSTTFARLTLLLPYLTLIESILYSNYFKYEGSIYDQNIFTIINTLWDYFALFWFVPYTILAIYLLVWSKGKKFKDIRARFIKAPRLMIYIAPFTYVAITIIASLFDVSFFGLGFLVTIIAIPFFIPASLIFGYSFIGIALLLLKLFHKMRIIKDITLDDSGELKSYTIQS